MRETGTLDGERIVAAALAVAINAALLMLLIRQMHWQALPARADPLEVVRVAPTAHVAPARVASARTPRVEPPVQAPPVPQRPPARDTTPAAVDRTPSATPSGGRPLTAVLLMQARTAAGPQPADFAPRPLDSRPVALPGRPADTFRMREPVTAAQVVASIGQLFGGSGYSAEACPELHRQVAQLGLADSEADRRHALELAQALCQ